MIKPCEIPIFLSFDFLPSSKRLPESTQRVPSCPLYGQNDIGCRVYICLAWPKLGDHRPQFSGDSIGCWKGHYQNRNKIKLIHWLQRPAETIRSLESLLEAACQSHRIVQRNTSSSWKIRWSRVAHASESWQKVDSGWCLGSLWFFCHGVFDEQFQGDQWVNRSTRLNDQLARTLDAVEAESLSLISWWIQTSDVGLFWEQR